MNKRKFFLIFGTLIFLSIVITGLIISSENGYNSTDVNIVQEAGFAHLNLSDSNLILYLPFDVQESLNNKTYDYTNNSYDGILKKGVFWNSSGYIGGAYDFDNLDDYIEIPDNNLLSFGNGTEDKPFSVSAWVKITNGTVRNFFLFSKSISYNNGEYYIELYDSNDRVYLLLIDNSSAGYIRASTVDTYPLDQWFHLSVTYDGSGSNSGIAIYIDGVNQSLSLTSDGSYTAMENTNLPVIIGKRGNAASTVAGSMDEMMVFDKALNSSEVLDIYNNQSVRFFSVGEMLFENNNFGVDNKFNISLSNCEAKKGSYLQGKINNGDYVNFTNCNITEYSVNGDLTNANITIKFISDSNQFYSPLVIGNITLNGWDTISPNVTISSPVSGITYTDSSVSFNVITNENSTCTYSLDAGTTTNALTVNSIGTGHIASASLFNSNYVVNIYCSDSQGNTNNFQSVSFAVAVPSSGGGLLVRYDLDRLEEGVSGNYPKNYLIKFDGQFIQIKSILEDKVELNVSGEIIEINFNKFMKVDSDKDGFYDLEISLGSVNFLYADLTIKSIYEKISAVDEENEIQVEDEELKGGESVDTKVGFLRRILNWIGRLFGK